MKKNIVIHGAGLSGCWSAFHAIVSASFDHVYLVDKAQSGECYRATSGTFTFNGNHYPDSTKWSHVLDRRAYALWQPYAIVTGRYRWVSDEVRRKRVINSMRHIRDGAVDFNATHPQFAPQGGAFHLPDDGFIDVLHWRENFLQDLQKRGVVIVDYTESEKSNVVLQQFQSEAYTHLYCQGAYAWPDPLSGPVVDAVVGISCDVRGHVGRGLFEKDEFILVSADSVCRVAGGRVLKKADDEIDADALEALKDEGDRWIKEAVFTIERASEWQVGLRPKPPRLFPVWGVLPSGEYYVNGLYKRGVQWAPAVTEGMINCILGKTQSSWFQQFFNRDLPLSESID